MMEEKAAPQRFFVFTTTQGVRFGICYPYTELTPCVLYHSFAATRHDLHSLGVETISDNTRDAFVFEQSPVQFIAPTPADAAMLLRDIS